VEGDTHTQQLSMEIRSCHAMTHSLASITIPAQDPRPLYYHHKNKKLEQD